MIGALVHHQTLKGSTALQKVTKKRIKCLYAYYRSYTSDRGTTDADFETGSQPLEGKLSDIISKKRVSIADAPRGGAYDSK
jgi:hypothetical protein